ncbi:MAG: prepilin-type N-terminal cleavage/methylation domain-containing protein [Desulfobacterales bacterium]|nr:prepilin-type N-terminal cleavage/methylation domain-containing protein [Desulfobacterales bacterium]
MTNDQDSGFTLLEVMIAMAIIAIALVAALGSQSQGVSLANEAKFTSTVVFLAQSKMAEIELKDPEDPISDDAGDFGEDFPGYRWEMGVSDPAFEGFEKVSDHIKKIDLSVYRAEGDRYQYRLSFCRFAPETK